MQERRSQRPKWPFRMPTWRSALMATAAAVLVFVATLVVAWAELRQYESTRSETRSTILGVGRALADFHERQGQYPASLAVIGGKAKLRDQWGRQFEYRRYEAGFVLRSLGRDQREGGVGLDGDVRYVEKTPMPLGFTERTWTLQVPPLTLRQSVEHFDYGRPVTGAAVIAAIAALIVLFTASRGARSWKKDLRQLAVVLFGSVLLALWITKFVGASIA